MTRGLDWREGGFSPVIISKYHYHHLGGSGPSQHNNNNNINIHSRYRLYTHLSNLFFHILIFLWMDTNEIIQKKKGLTISNIIAFKMSPCPPFKNGIKITHSDEAGRM